MDKLIHLSEACDLMGKYANRNPDVSSLCYDIRYGLMRLPTISPDDVRGVGEWEHQELAPTNWTFCSVCWRQRSKKYKWYYCPNCGARMSRAEAEKAMEVRG